MNGGFWFWVWRYAWVLMGLLAVIYLGGICHSVRGIYTVLYYGKDHDKEESK